MRLQATGQSAPRIAVTAVDPHLWQTTYSVLYGDSFWIYEDEQGRRAKMMPNANCVNGTVTAIHFATGIESYNNWFAASGHAQSVAHACKRFNRSI